MVRHQLACNSHGDDIWTESFRPVGTDLLELGLELLVEDGAGRFGEVFDVDASIGLRLGGADLGGEVGEGRAQFWVCGKLVILQQLRCTTDILLGRRLDFGREIEVAIVGEEEVVVVEVELLLLLCRREVE